MSYRTLTSKKPLNTSIQVLLKKGAYVGFGIGAFAPVLAFANPTGGQVVAGTATIKNSNANTTVVKQSSASAIIDWQQFNIGKGQYVQFLQPSSSSVILNRVIGGGGSSIFGSLTGNGQVFLVNTNGVFFGKGASIDAQGFLASTLDIADSDFLSGHYLFDKGTNGDATIVNQGTITAHKGGYVVLAGDYAENDGLISAQSGHIVLASGSKSTLTLNGNSLVSYAVNQATLANLAGANNAGKLQADGGTVIMTADVANLLKATVVNNTGLIEAHAISKSGGTIQLLATGGNIVNAGTLDASATRAGQQGGTITLKGDERTTLTSASKIFATGDGANGGHVEVSGDTLSMRGAMNLGKGGNLLLDPNEVTIVTGNGSSGASQGTTSGADLTIGAGFIQTQLNNNTNVEISAHDFIHASSHVKTIKATGTGNLSLHTGSAESGINLKGVDVTIGGNFSASFGYGTFGHITAKGINLVDHNAGADVVLAGATATAASLKATGGNISITAFDVETQSGGSLKMQAASDIFMHGKVSNAGNVTMAASGEGISANIIKSGKNISLTAADVAIAGPGGLSVSAGGNISIKGAIRGGSDIGRDVTIKAGGNITLDHDIGLGITSVNHTLKIQGKQLTYTGAGAFKLSAGYGNLILDASIGSAKAAAKYDVTLDGGIVRVDRSIITAGAIQVDASSGLGHTGSRAFIGNSSGEAHALTLSSKKSIVISGGHEAVIGGNGAVTITADDGNAKTTSDDVTIQGLRVSIRGNTAQAFDSSAANLTVDNSVTLHAGQDLLITGAADSVSIGGATASAELSGKAATATAKNDVSLSAGHDVNISGIGVLLRGGRTFASVEDAVKATATATAEANLSITAGHDVILNANGNVVDVSGGYAQVIALTGAVKQSATANASATVAVKAAHDITISGGHIFLEGGHQIGRGASVIASQSGAKAVGTARGDLTFTAGDAINITGTELEILGGSSAAGAHGTFSGSNCGGFCSEEKLVWQPATAHAVGENATANLTATANVSLNAGAGGMTLAGGAGGVQISAGYGVAFDADVDAGTLGGAKAAMDAEAKVALTTSGKGDVHITGKTIDVRGGGRAGAWAEKFFFGSFSSGFRSGSSGHDVTNVTAAAGETASLKADGSLSIKAGGDVTMFASGNHLNISAGYSAANSLSVDAVGSKAAANAAVTSVISITAGGIINLSDTVGGVQLTAGPGSFDEGAGRGAFVEASFGAKAGLTVDASMTLSAHSDVKLTGTAVNAFTGVATLADAHVTATSSAAVANASALDGLTINAGGELDATATAGGVAFEGGIGIASEAHVIAIGASAKAGLSADNRILITTGHAMTLKGRDILFAGGHDAADSAHITGSAGGAATLSAKSGVNLTVGGALSASASTTAVNFSAGAFAGGDAHLTGNQGTATLVADASLTLTTKGAITLKANGNIGLEGSDDPGYTAVLQASNGTVNETALNDVVVKSGGAFTANAGADVFISGSDEAAYEAALTAKGAAKATLLADNSVTLTATSISLTGNAVEIRSSDDAADSLHVTAASGGVANAIVRNGVAIQDAGAFAITTLSGTMDISTGEFNGGDANLQASHGTAALEVDSGVSIAAKSVTLIGGGAIEIETGEENGSAAKLNADHGTATETVLGGIVIKSGGAFTASAGGALTISGSYYAGQKAVLTGKGAGAKTSLNVDNSVTLTAGAVTLDAVSNVMIQAGNRVAGSASLTASSGAVVSETARANMTIKAGGDFTVNAQGEAEISGGYEAGSQANLTSKQGTTNLLADGSVTITTPGNMTIKGRTFVGLEGSDDAGSGASVLATRGTATETGLGNVTLTAGKAFLASASAGSLDASGSEGVIRSADVEAHGTGAKASLTGDTSVIIKAGTTLTLKAKKSVDVSAGSEENGEDAFVEASSGGVAAVTGRNGITLSAPGNILISASTGHIALQAGDSAAENASVFANHGTASLNVDSSVNITTKGTLTLKSGKYQEISASDAAGSEASMKATRGTATLDVQAGVALTAGGAFTASAGSFIEIQGGDDAGYDVDLTAKGAATKLSLTAQNGVTIKAGGAISLKAHKWMEISGSEDAAEDITAHASSGAAINEIAFNGVDITAGGAFLASALTSFLEVAAGEDVGSDQTVTANHASVSINADGGVHINAKTNLTLKAGTWGEISASDDAGEDDTLTAIRGTITETALGNVSLTAGGKLTASYNGTFSEISGGDDAVDDATLTAKGTGAKVTLLGDNSVRISGTDVLLKNAGGYLHISGSESGGRSTSIHASSGAVVNATGLTGVSIVARGKFSASAAGNLDIEGGEDIGEEAHINASGNATKATLTADGSVSITAAGAVALKGGNGVFISGSWDVASDGTMHGISGGAAALSAKAGVAITAGGNFLASAAAGALDISGGGFAGGDAKLTAVRGTATLTADTGIVIKVHGSATLKAKTSMTVQGGSEAGSAASIQASNGKATETVFSGVSLTATGAITAQASTALAISGGARIGADGAAIAQSHGNATLIASGAVDISAGGAVSLTATTGLVVTAGHSVMDGVTTSDGAHAHAHGSGAVASLSGDGSLAIKGSSVSLTAGGALSINSLGTPGRSGGKYTARFASGSADGKGTAKLNAVDSLDITATGALTVKAGGKLTVHTGNSAAVGVVLSASDAGATTTLNADDTLNLTAQSVTFSAGNANLLVYAGQSIGAGGFLGAFHGATATENVKGGLNVTASKSVAATITGTGTGHGLSFFATRNTALGMHVSASYGGVATANVDNSLSVKVTGAGGTITMKTGAGQTNANMSIYGASNLASQALVDVNAGKATLNASGTVNLTAPGAINLTVSHGGLSIYGGNSGGKKAAVSGNNKNGVATLNANDSANIKGGNITLTGGGGSVQIYGAYRGIASSVHLVNEEGGQAVANVNGTANVTASGNLTVNASTDLYVYAGTSGAKHTHISGSVGSATLVSRNDVNLTAAGNISLTGGKLADIYGMARQLGLSAVYVEEGGKASVTLSADANIKAGKALTVNAGAGSNLSIFGGESVLKSGATEAIGKGGNLSVDAHANVIITAGTSINLTGVGGVEIFGSRAGALSATVVGENSGAKASVDVESRISIKSGTDINIGAGSRNVVISGGDAGASHATLVGDNGTATLDVDASVSLAATGKLTMTLAGHDLIISGGSFGGRHAFLAGEESTGKATLGIDQTVSLTAGGALKETGAANLKIVAGTFAATSIDPVINLLDGGKANASVDSGITIKGSSLSVAHSGTLTLTSATSLNSGGLVEKGKVTIVGGHITGLFPLGGITFNSGSIATLGSVGGLIPIGGGMSTGGVTITVKPGKAAPLQTVANDGLLVNLETVLSSPVQSIAKAYTDFTPSHASADYQGGGCVVTLVKENGGSCRIR